MTDLHVQLDYNKENGSRPFLFCRPMTEQERLFYLKEEGGSRDLVDVVVRDGRNHNLTLDRRVVNIHTPVSLISILLIW